MTHAIGIERAIEAGIDADIIPLTGEYAGYPGVRLIEYLEMKPASAAELGVVLTLGKDGKPRWHSYSDIAVDEQRDYQTAILTPIIEAAIAAYLSALKPSGDAGEATAWRIAGGMLTNIREVAERYRSDGVEVVPLVPASLITTLERQLATAREMQAVPYYFGTDIPLPLQETEVTARYVPRNSFIPASKWPLIVGMAALSWAIVGMAAALLGAIVWFVVQL